jgi:hypothetical protein
MTVRRNLFLGLVSVLAMFLLAGCGGTPTPPDGSDDGWDGGLDDCVQDNSTKGSTADEWKLVPGGDPVSGYICPRRDVDHYWLEVADARTIIGVSLSNNTPLSPVDLCYDIFRQGSDVRLGGKCDSDGTDGITELYGTHYLQEPGTYFVEVRDEGGDDEDPRLLNNYLLSVELVPDPDTYEPNNTAAEAKEVGGQPGYISYQGDQDWFKVTTGSDGMILSLGLTNSAQTPVDLRYDVFMPDMTTRPMRAPTTS